MEIFALIGLIVLNGVFAMSEIALVTARKARLMKLASEGDTSAGVALRLADDPNKFLSTIQIGITSIGVLSGIIGEAIFATPLSSWLHSIGLTQSTADVTATAAVVVIITYITIVVGELVPKRIGQINPETIARVVAHPMRLLAVVTRPFVVLLSFSTQTVLALMGIKQAAQASVTEEEIHAMLEEGSEAGVIEQHQHEMVRNVFRLDDRQLGSLMIPRLDIFYIDITECYEENLRKLIESEHSRFPVCDGGLDKILGITTAKKVLASVASGKSHDYTRDLQTAVYVPETLTGMELLEQFRNSNMQMVFVIDEYGELEGMVTLDDVLEALTGEFNPVNEEDAWAVQRADGSWLLDGAIPIPELKDRLQLIRLPEEDKGRYHTLSGVIMLLLSRLPKTGDIVEWDQWRFEVVDMDNKRIDKVLASQLAESAEHETPSSE